MAPGKSCVPKADFLVGCRPGSCGDWPRHPGLALLCLWLVHSQSICIIAFATDMSLIHYNACPSCHSDEIKPVLTATDYTVSHESFQIWQCQSCTLRFTQDVPDATAIGPYYHSEDYISHSNTTRGWVNMLYHKVRKLTLSDKRRLIQSATRK